MFITKLFVAVIVISILHPSPARCSISQARWPYELCRVQFTSVLQSSQQPRCQYAKSKCWDPGAVPTPADRFHNQLGSNVVLESNATVASAVIEGVFTVSENAVLEINPNSTRRTDCVSEAAQLHWPLNETDIRGFPIARWSLNSSILTGSLIGVFRTRPEFWYVDPEQERRIYFWGDCEKPGNHSVSIYRWLTAAIDYPNCIRTVSGSGDFVDGVRYDFALMTQDPSGNPPIAVEAHNLLFVNCAAFECENNPISCSYPVNQTIPLCVCRAGFSGNRCQTNINECASDPCKFGATCIDQINGYLCVCAAGYEGRDCSTNKNECASIPCQNGGSCTDLINQFQCTCPPGYSGAQCQYNINECSSTPCKNGGSCTDLINGYTCDCAAGWSGTHCQTDNNECASIPCRHNGTCIDQINRFECQCPLGYQGDICETVACDPNPCLDGERCTSDAEGNLVCEPQGFAEWKIAVSVIVPPIGVAVIWYSFVMWCCRFHPLPERQHQQATMPLEVIENERYIPGRGWVASSDSCFGIPHWTHNNSTGQVYAGDRQSPDTKPPAPFKFALTQAQWAVTDNGKFQTRSFLCIGCTRRRRWELRPVDFAANRVALAEAAPVVIHGTPSLNSAAAPPSVPPEAQQFQLEALRQEPQGAMSSGAPEKFDGKDVWVKRASAADSYFLECLRSEAKAYETIGPHPNVVQFYRKTDAPNEAIHLEIASFGSLYQFVREYDEQLCWPDKITMLYNIAAAIKHVHDRNYIHRDIKPQNILIFPERVPKLCDFGLSRRFDEKTNETAPTKNYFTSNYGAPEQEESGPLTPAVDIRQFGGLIYFMAKKEHPPAMMYAIPVPPDLKQLMPLDLHDLMVSCYAQEPADRPKIDQVLNTLHSMKPAKQQSSQPQPHPLNQRPRLMTNSVPVAQTDHKSKPDITGPSNSKESVIELALRPPAAAAGSGGSLLSLYTPTLAPDGFSAATDEDDFDPTYTSVVVAVSARSVGSAGSGSGGSAGSLAFSSRSQMFRISNFQSKSDIND